MYSALLVILALETAAVEKTPADSAAYQARTYTHATADGKTQAAAYRLLSPEHVEAGKKYPLVVFLHGAGERGSDNLAQLKYFPEWMAAAEMRAKYPCFLLAPQCPANEKWVDSPWDKKHSQPMPKEPSESMKQVIGMMEQLLKSEPIDTHRVYLTGLSMGGYGSWDLAERMPERFAAVAPLCGGGDDTKVDRLVGIPIWAFHGDADPAVPVEALTRNVRGPQESGRHAKVHRAARRRPRLLDHGLQKLRLDRLDVRASEEISRCLRRVRCHLTGSNRSSRSSGCARSRILASNVRALASASASGNPSGVPGRLNPTSCSQASPSIWLRSVARRNTSWPWQLVERLDSGKRSMPAVSSCKVTDRSVRRS